MRFVLVVLLTIFGLDSLFYSSRVWAQSEDASRPRSGWYVGATIGVGQAGDIDQNGWNRDSFCYPTDACFDLDPIPEISGYSWRYNVEPARGNTFGVSLGRLMGSKRFELSLDQKKNGVSQVFRGVTNLEGVAMEDREGGTVDSNTRSSIDDLVVRSLTLNVFLDLPVGQRGIAPYVGGGMGVAHAAMTGTHYSDNHTETSSSGQAYDPPLSFYNGSQDGDLADVVLVGSLHAGAEYPVSDRTMLELKLTYSMTGGMNVRGEYDIHPMHSIDPDFPSHNSFTGARLWTLTLNARRSFGN